MMSAERCQLIPRFLPLHVNEDPQHNPQDALGKRLLKLRNILEKMIQWFSSVYYLPQDITVDESLVLCRGRLPFK